MKIHCNLSTFRPYQRYRYGII